LTVAHAVMSRTHNCNDPMRKILLSIRILYRRQTAMVHELPRLGGRFAVADPEFVTHRYIHLR
jgi:hypothetical protein